MIALGCDHGGFPLMKEVIAYLDANNIPYRIMVHSPKNPWIIPYMANWLPMR